MTITAELEDGRKLEFPDGTDQTVIQNTVKKVIGSGQPAAAPAAPAPKPTNAIDEKIVQFLSSRPQLMSTLERMAGQGTPFGRVVQGAADLPVGAMQLGMNAVGAGDVVNPEIAAINQRTEQLRRADAGTTDWWRLAGSMANPLPWKAAGAVSAPTAVGRIAQAGGVGALTGIQPVTEGDYGDKAVGNALVSGGVSTIIPGGVEGVRKVSGLVRNMVGPMVSKEGADFAAGRVARLVAGDRVDDVINNLQTANRNVNAGQAALPAGSAEFSALQDIANKRKPSEAVALKALQEARRAGAIERIAGGADDTKLMDKVDFRSAQGANDYGVAGSKLVQSDSFLDRLMQRPSMQKAIERAEQLAKERDESFSLGKDISVANLHKVKMGLDDLIKDSQLFGISKSERGAILDTRKMFLGWLENKEPLYRTARENFRDASVPINRMEVGREMQKKLASAIGEKPGTFLNTLNDAAQVLKTATGSNRYNNLGEVLTPSEMKVVNSVGTQLENEIRMRTLAKAGAEKTRKIVGESSDTALQINFLNKVATVINAVTRRIETGAGEKSMESLADMMIKNPRYLAKIMIEAKPAERSAIIDGLVRMQAIPVGTLAAQPVQQGQQGQQQPQQ